MNESNQQSGGGRRKSLAGSGLITALVLAVLLGALGLVWAAHVRGKIHKLRERDLPVEAGPEVLPGGQEPVQLHRMQRPGSLNPEFTSLTALPGLGMQILQAKLNLPGRGDVPIFLGTSEADLPKLLDPATNQPRSPLLSSAFSVLSAPGSASGDTAAVEAVGSNPSQQISTDVLPDGSGVTAIFSGAPAAGRGGTTLLRSGIETAITTSLTGRGLDILLNAKNVSTEARSVVVAWTPRFAAPATGLAGIVLLPPQTGESGLSAPVTDPPILLGKSDVHRRFSGLRHTYLSMGPEVILKNLTDGYAIKITAMTPSIRTVLIDADHSSAGVAVTFSSALSDGPAGRTTLAPGDSMQWRLRLEAVTSSEYAMPRP